MAYIETTSESDASGDLAKLYQRAANPDGTVDNVMKVHALNPESLRTHLEMYIAAMRRHSPLSHAEREMAAVVVSRLNGCQYCLRHHKAGLQRLLGPERQQNVDDLATGRVTALSDRESALVNYAMKLTTNPHGMDHRDVLRLREAGLDDRAILDLAQVVAYFNYVNRIVQGLGVELEAGEDALGQWPRDDGK